SLRHDSPSSTASALAVLLAVSRNKTSTNLQPRASPIRWYGKWGQVNDPTYVDPRGRFGYINLTYRFR
ncbi:MAG: hypothetical protein N3F11_10075, partial [Casimicrobiaceae bacterium]|nr:hypothetical protein [Casimicrobiaceae bacterium]